MMGFSDCDDDGDDWDDGYRFGYLDASKIGADLADLRVANERRKLWRLRHRVRKATALRRWRREQSALSLANGDRLCWRARCKARGRVSDAIMMLASMNLDVHGPKGELP